MGRSIPLRPVGSPLTRPLWGLPPGVEPGDCGKTAGRFSWAYG